LWHFIVDFQRQQQQVVTKTLHCNSGTMTATPALTQKPLQPISQRQPDPHPARQNDGSINFGDRTSAASDNLCALQLLTTSS
jgi:hypothetical protein